MWCQRRTRTCRCDTVKADERVETGGSTSQRPRETIRKEATVSEIVTNFFVHLKTVYKFFNIWSQLHISNYRIGCGSLRKKKYYFLTSSLEILQLLTSALKAPQMITYMTTSRLTVVKMLLATDDCFTPSAKTTAKRVKIHCT